MNRDNWSDVVDLIERVIGEDDLLPSVVTGVRSTVREIAVLPAADIAGHTRALLAAATRALAARRGPTEAELSFVEELGTTRAQQGVAIEAVLGAIHVAERAIWSRAREAADACGMDAVLLLDARELYDDWAQAVRARLIRAHRVAGTGRQGGTGDRDLTILRRLLEGGSAATLAAAEAGLPVTGGLWVLVARPGDTALEHALRGQGQSQSQNQNQNQGQSHARTLSAHVDGLLVGVCPRAPSAPVTGTAMGLAGPAEPEELGTMRRLALAALTAAESIGRTGVVHVADVAVLAAVTDRADLGAMLADRHRPARAALGAGMEPVALAVRAWLEAGRDVASAADRLFVHPNTVRNRVQRFADATGIDPADTFGAMNAWWLCCTWLGSRTAP